MSTINSGLPLVRSGLVVALDAASNRSYSYGNTAPIPSGVYATFSVDYLVTGATNYPSQGVILVYENYGGSALSSNSSVLNNYQDVWQRAVMTAGPTGGSGTQAMFLYPGYCGPSRLADSGTIYFRNPKVEFVNADTGASNFSSMSNVTTWYNVGTGSLNGTLNNSVQYYPNGYFKFDGVDDYSEVPYSSLLDTNSFTVMGVFRTSTNDNTHDTIVSRNSDVYAGAYNGWNISRLRSGLSPTNSFRVMVYGSSASVELYGPNIVDNAWRHYAVTVSSSGIYIYINGTLYTSTTSMPTGNYYPSSGSPPLKIGANRSNSDIWSGDIASCYVYNRVLNSSEIRANYQLSRNKFPV